MNHDRQTPHVLPEDALPLAPDRPGPAGWFTEVCAPAGVGFSLQIERVLHEEQTPFQRLAVYETTHFGRLLALDGLVMLTERDHFLYHEMMTHPALFTHAAPRRVAIVGGGDCGTLQQVLLHPEVESVHQIEIDRRVTEVAARWFPELAASREDPRAALCFADGIRWIADAPPGSLDVIIVDSTDPIGPAVGLFERPFLEGCRRALADGGILVQQSESPLLHLDTIIRPLRAAMRAAGFSDARTLTFPQPCYPSGWWSCTVAGEGLDLGAFRAGDVERRRFQTRYYNRAIHQSALAAPEFMRE